jgi:hypothetical protein
VRSATPSSRGDETFTSLPTLPGDPDTIAVKRDELADSGRNEWIPIGSNLGDATFVLLDRVMSQRSSSESRPIALPFLD